MATPPTHVMVPPSAVAHEVNGAVAPELRGVVDRTGYYWEMAALPARGMRALHAAILKDLGITLSTTGRGRDLATQWNGFGGGAARYRPCTVAEYNAAPNRGKQWPFNDYIYAAGLPAPGRDTVAKKLGITIPNSTYWTKIQLPGGGWPATAAVPGTSPHGLSCADDVCLPGAKALTTQVLNWLYTNETRFGFYHSAATNPADFENWHLQWGVGDTVPQAVLDYENQQNPGHPEPPPTKDDEMYLGIYYTNDGVGTILTGQCTKVGSTLQVSWVKTPAELDMLLANPDAIKFDGLEGRPQYGKGNFGACTIVGDVPPGWSGQFKQRVVTTAS